MSIYGWCVGPLLHYELQIPIIPVAQWPQKETKAVLDEQNEMKDPGGKCLNKTHEVIHPWKLTWTPRIDGL